jgi:hypothetical protein
MGKDKTQEDQEERKDEAGCDEDGTKVNAHLRGKIQAYILLVMPAAIRDCAFKRSDSLR